MAGRNLFATEETTQAASEGRDLFAPVAKEEATAIPEPQPKAETTAIPETKPKAERTQEEIALDARKAQTGYGEKDEGPNLFERIKEAATGEQRTTEEIAALPEIGNAPELNAFNRAAFKASLGLLTQFNPEGEKGVIQQNFPDAKISEDEKGNVIVEFESGRYALNTPGFSAQDAAKALFGVASGAHAPALIGSGGGLPAVLGTGAVEAGIDVATQLTGEALGGEDYDVQQTIESGVLGAGFKGLEDTLGQVSRIKQGDFTDAQKEVIETAKEQGVPLMTTDILPPTTFAGKSAQQVGEKIPIAGTGKDRARQEAARQEAARRFYENYEAPKYDEIVTSLKDAKTLKQRQAGNVLERIGNQLDDTGDLYYSNTNAELGRAFDKLTQANRPKGKEGLDKLLEIQEGLNQAPQSFSSFKEWRTDLNDFIAASGKGERSQLPTKEQALLKRVASAMTKDMKAKAKANLSDADYKNWEKANETYGEMAETVRKTKIKNILDKGDITPEIVDGLLFSKKPSEIRLLYNQLDDSGRKNARAAIIQRAITVKGFDNLTPTVFSNRLNDLSPSTKVFFQGEDGRALKGLQTVLDTTRRAPQAAVATATGQQAIPFIAGAQGLASLVVGGTAGMLASIYESPTVRNAMIKLANTPKGSTKFDRNLTTAMDTLRVGLQTAIKDEETTDVITGNEL